MLAISTTDHRPREYNYGTSFIIIIIIIIMLYNTGGGSKR